MKRLTKKTIAVFGAYGLVGSAITRLAAENGAKVIALGRNASKLNALASGLSGDVTTRQVALDSTQGTLVFDDATKIDMVLTPLGGPLGMAAFVDLRPDQLIEPMTSKLAIQVAAVQSVLQHLREDAEIVLFSGLLSRQPMAGLSAMTATNAAIEALTKAIALELSPMTMRCVSSTLVTPAGEAEAGDGSVTPECVARAALSSTPTGTIVDVVTQHSEHA